MKNQEEFQLSVVSGNVKEAMHEAGAKSRDLWQVPIRGIYIQRGLNVRERNDAYRDHIRGLADSMKANGFYQDKPLACFVAMEEGRQVLYVADGHSRHEAALIAISEGANIETIPVVVKSSSTSEEDLTVALITSNSGTPLTPFETGVVCKRLQSFGWDEEGIATRTTLSLSYVKQLLALMGAPLGIRDMVRSGALSADNAIATLRKHGDKALPVLQKAMGGAEAKGKNKVTAKDLPGAALAKAVRKAAPEIFRTLQQVHEDPAFVKLQVGTRESLLNIIDSLPQGD